MLRQPRFLTAALITATLAASPSMTLAQTTTDAAAFEGDYTVAGEMEGGRSYKGIARVAKTGDTYTIAWKIGQESHLGTGILTGGQLSTVFVGGGIPGIAVYRKSSDGKVLGIYTQFGGTKTAIETWDPVKPD